MGAKCCKAFNPLLDPKKVHVKKIKDIFANYFKNQNLGGDYKGHEELSVEIIDSVERYSKGAAKDLVNIM